MRKDEILEVEWVDTKQAKKTSKVQVKYWDEAKLEGLIQREGKNPAPGYFWWTEIKSIKVITPPVEFLEGDIMTYENNLYVWHDNQIYRMKDYAFDREHLEEQVRRGEIKFLRRGDGGVKFNGNYKTPEIAQPYTINTDIGEVSAKGLAKGIQEQLADAFDKRGKPTESD